MVWPETCDSFLPVGALEFAVTVSVSSRSSSRKTSARRKGARKPARDIAQEVTDRIVAALEAGTVPWRSQHTATGAPPRLPVNAVTGREYRGVNVLLLWMEQMARGFGSPAWCTYKQAAEAGGQVRKGETSTRVVFYGVTGGDREKPEEERKGRPFLKTFNVFNADQVDGLSGTPTPVDLGGSEAGAVQPERLACEEIALHYGRAAGAPRLFHQDVTPHYVPRTDSIVVPSMEAFENPAAYFATLFHEMAHSTGAASRLARPAIVDFQGFGSESYVAEEMVAELAAALLCAHAGIASETEEMSAAYIAGWLEQAKQDKRFFLRAASAAQKAADLIRPPAEQAPEA